MPPAWLQLLPPLFDPWRSNKVQKKGAKLFKDFSSYTLAYQELKEQTGLLYLHLNKTDHLKHSLTLEGPLHIEHTVDLDRMEFFVQRKADLVYPALESWVARGEVERAKSALSSLITLLKLRLDKGIFDKDPDLNTNFGFLGTSAIQIDVGRFKRKLSPLSSSERLDALTHITANLKQKLDRCAPELSSFLMQKILEEEGG